MISMIGDIPVIQFLLMFMGVIRHTDILILHLLLIHPLYPLVITPHTERLVAVFGIAPTTMDMHNRFMVAILTMPQDLALTMGDHSMVDFLIMVLSLGLAMHHRLIIAAGEGFKYGHEFGYGYGESY